MEAFHQSYVILQDVTPLTLTPGAAATQERRLYAVGYRALLRLFDLPLHDGSHFTLTGSGIAEEW